MSDRDEVLALIHHLLLSLTGIYRTPTWNVRCESEVLDLKGFAGEDAGE